MPHDVAINRSRIEYGYLQLFLAIDDLLGRTGSGKKIDQDHERSILEKHRNLMLQDIPGANPRLLQRCQDEVDSELPTRYWMQQCSADSL